MKDAFSTIKGMDVDSVSQNSIEKFFSSKESKEIDFHIPKLINESPLFDDTAKLDILKSAFINAVNKDEMSQSTTVYNLYYDSEKIAKFNGKKLDWNFEELDKEQKQEILTDLDKRISKLYPKSLGFIGEVKIETAKVLNNGTLVEIKATYSTALTSYKVNASYKLRAGKWEIMNDSFEVTKK